MTFPAAIIENSLIFLGAGFSVEAKNKVGDPPPVGSGLAKLIAAELKVDPDQYPLALLAETLNEDNDQALYRIVQSAFTISEVSPHQRSILKRPWRRIYTTNFDDVAEAGTRAEGRRVDSFSYEEPFPRRVAPGSIIHLHGSIRNVTPDNVLSKVVLGEASYVRQHLERSRWYDQFLEDVKYCDAVFFLGYSLSDPHIAALLIQNPTNIPKTFFVERAGFVDPLFQRKLERYGRVEAIGLKGFAEYCEQQVRAAPVSDLYSLKSFRFVDPQPDKKTHRVPTAQEVRNLLLYGKIDVSALMSSTSGEATYTVHRDELIEQAVIRLRSSRTLVIDARLGNGKSVFELLLISRLAQEGFHCFLYRGRETVSQSEIDFLNTQKNVVIVFDSHGLAQDAINYLSRELPAAKFISEARSSVYEVRLHEIEERFPKPQSRLTVNRLSPHDVDQLLRLFTSVGLGHPQSPHPHRTWEIRDMLLAAFSSPNIREKIRNSLGPAFESQASRRVLLVAYLLQVVQGRSDLEFVRLVTGVDPYQTLKLLEETTAELVIVSDGEFTLRSSIFAEFAIRELVPETEIRDTLSECAEFAASRADQRRYRHLAAAFMQYTSLHEVFRESPTKLDTIEMIYERLRWHTWLKAEPLFWLQFALLMIDRDNLIAAKDFLNSAYRHAEHRPGFRPYQIDTQYLRLLFLMEQRKDIPGQGTRLDEVLGYLDKVANMLREESHRFYVIKVLDQAPLYIEKVRRLLTASQKIQLQFALKRLADSLGSLAPEYRAQSGSDLTKAALEQSISQLAA